MCYTQICPRFECLDEHTIHTCVYCVLALNAGTGRGVCVCLFFFFLLFFFESDGNLFWVYHNGNFLPGKSISRREKNQENDFAPSEKYACYAPVYSMQNMS